ncbi:hypothetical protein CIPAW_11G132100 [Carya illinoinensis]|uniref:Uncharacterized protein n=1 Tax=Carya illinoinensis TaxID=32201 RepID=A0A8T1P793_CARIL|nr:hypothetical protein CIPAW_11G132100 [Carya illinoinensis]
MLILQLQSYQDSLQRKEPRNLYQPTVEDHQAISMIRFNYEVKEITLVIHHVEGKKKGKKRLFWFLIYVETKGRERKGKTIPEMEELILWLWRSRSGCTYLCWGWISVEGTG